MYAIIRAGHRQFRVRAGTILRVTSFLKSDKGKDMIKFPVVATEEGSGIVLGTPLVEKAQVTASVLREGKTKKVLVFKKKRRKGYRRTKGHRQNFLEVKISEIKFPSGKVEKAQARKQATKPKLKAKETKSVAKSATQKTVTKKKSSQTKKSAGTKKG